MAEQGNEIDPEAQHLFLRADEVDSGTTVLSPSKQLPLSALRPTNSNAPDSPSKPKAPQRPILRREGSSAPPPPPSQPPPAPPPDAGTAVDSLSLGQLKQLVGNFPKTEQRAYAFQYAEAEDFYHEVDEWYHYTELEQDRQHLLSAREAFEQSWKTFCDLEFGESSDQPSWLTVDESLRDKFVASLLDFAKQSTVPDSTDLTSALYCFHYITAGVWSLTSGIEPTAESPSDHHTNQLPQESLLQVEWMHKGADLLAKLPVLELIYTSLQVLLRAHAQFEDADRGEEGHDGVFDEEDYRIISLCFSTLYILVESARSRLDLPAGRRIRLLLLKCKPNLLHLLTTTISRLRWDETYNIPLMSALQLFWKTTLLLFGDCQSHLTRIKSILQPQLDQSSSDPSHPMLTASPLDYHLFRQEVTSKYPAYNPPLPIIPLEVDQKSLLPPLPKDLTKDGSPEQRNGHGANRTANTGSILHQPVHIATPAPSPPPSPGGPGGKAGKKQNYQTNQNFPFLYPPLDSTSNDLGGKGSTAIQDAMVRNRWEGSDIPASIIEAGELFASRMRMTRAMKQLWHERDLFMKYERGWFDPKERPTAQQHDSDDEQPTRSAALDVEQDRLDDPDLAGRLNVVEEYFHHALPELQSLVIVMMKVMLTNVQDIALRNGNMQDAAQSGGLNRSKSNASLNQNQNLPMPPAPPKPAEMSLEDLDNIRSREISQKAISGSIFLLLKWFKISHVLKFEYLTQLLLDSNYVQLTLKYFAHQNLEDLVAIQYDRDDLSFFHYCHIHSDHPPLSPTSPDEHSEDSSPDEAIPPPIQRHRRSPTSSDPTQRTNAAAAELTAAMTPAGTSPPASQPTPHPSVDELGNPTHPLPATPITTFSARHFLTSIHLLRVLQKITRSKPHRILLLVQFKSAQILRRVLRVPESMLRLYVLKLFKSQVPYCGRKWRQSNMRVITAIYLHCRPELRDEWLAGMHEGSVEGELDDAVPLEWALRGLTYWWMKRTYADVLDRKKLKGSKEDHEDKDEKETAEGPGQEIQDDERDFFQRELDAMGWGLAGLSVGEDVGFGEEAPGVNGTYVNGNATAGDGDNYHGRGQESEWR